MPRFKTKVYEKYEEAALFILPDFELPPAPYLLRLEFGFSSIASDIDNPVKPTLDILSKKYKFNDKHVKRLIVDRMQVKRGMEYIIFELKTFVV